MKLLLIGNFLMRLGVHFIERLAGILIVPILIAKVGVDGYGYYGLASGIILLFVNIICLRFTMAMIRFYPGSRVDAGPIVAAGLLYWMGFSLVTLAIIAIAPARLSLLAFADSEKTHLLFLAVGVGLLATFYEFITATSRAENRLGLVSLVDAGERLMFIMGCLVLFALLTPTVEIALSLFLIGTLLRIVVTIYPAIRGVRLRRPKAGLVRSMFLFCLPFLPYLASVWLIERSPFFAVAQKFGHAATGILMLAFTLASLLAAVTSPLQTALYPMLSRAYDEGRVSDVQECVSIAMRITLSSCVFGTLTLVVGTPLLLSLLQIEAATPPRLLVALLCIAVTLAAIRQLVINLIHIEMKTGALVWIGTLGAVGTVVSSLLLLDAWGFYGAAVAMIVGSLSQVAAMYFVARSDLMAKPANNFFGALLISALVSLTLQYAGLQAGEWVWLCCVAMSGLTFMAGLYLLGGVTANERDALKRRMKCQVRTAR